MFSLIYSLYPNVIVSKQSHFGPFTHYKVMAQVADRVFWYHVIRWRHRPTYCITRCKDEQCRALWRHWPSSAGVRPIFWKRVLSIFWNTVRADVPTMKQCNIILFWNDKGYIFIVLSCKCQYHIVINVPISTTQSASDFPGKSNVF